MDILRERGGVCRQYVKIFSEMCELGRIRVKNLKGFCKGPGYTPGKIVKTKTKTGPKIKHGCVI